MKTKLIVIDLDETMVTKSRYPIRAVVESVNRLACRVLVLTGREEAQREQTLKDLDFARIVYDELSLMPTVDMDIAEYKRATVERLLEEYDVLAFVDDNDDNRAAVESLDVYVMTPDEFVDAAVNSGLFAENEDLVGYETREVSRVAPGFMAASARRGLRLHEEGESGDGLMPATVADARRMAEGEPLSVDKWRRIPGWIARHMMDLDAVDGDEITPGLVAMLLWGGGSSKSSARRTQAYAERMVERLADDEDRAQPRKPNGQFDFGGDPPPGYYAGGGFGGAGGAGGGGAGAPAAGSAVAPPGSESYANAMEIKLQDQQAGVVGADKLTGVEEVSLRSYTGEGHFRVNQGMRGAPPPPLTGDQLENAKAKGESINGIINRTPPLTEPVVLQRGVAIQVLGAQSSSELNGLVGAEFVDKGIISTSLKQTTARNFSGGGDGAAILVINVPKGNRAYAVPEGLGFQGGLEAEVLLPSGTKFKITKVVGNEVYVDVSPTSGRAATVDSEQRAPAPKKDQIKGSDTNPAGSAAGKTGDITLSESTNKALQNKADEHNADMAAGDRPNWTRVRVGTLRSVYRRGSGAYSSSHRPGIGRAQWSMARVNAFLHLVRTGKPKNPKYVTDNDLLHADHPRRTDGEDRAQPRKPNGQFDHGSDSGGGGDAPASGDVKQSKLAANLPAKTPYGRPGYKEYAEKKGDQLLDQQADTVGPAELTGVEYDDIESYTGTGHYDVNKSARGAPPPPLTGRELKNASERRESINGVISRTPPLTEPVVLQRGVAIKALGVQRTSELDSLVGAEFVDKGIISTSLDRNIAYRFSNSLPGDDAVLVINVPKGNRAYAIPKTLAASGASEFEVLLPSNTKFKVTKVVNNEVYVDVVG